MKKLLATALIATMSLTIISCAGNGENNSEEKPQLEKCHPYQAFSTYMHINEYCHLVETLAGGYSENAELGMRDDLAGSKVINGPGENLVYDLKNEKRYYDIIMNDMRMLREMPKEYEWCTQDLLECEKDITDLHETITDVGMYYTCMDLLYLYIEKRFAIINLNQVTFASQFHDSIGTEKPEAIVERFK